MSDDPPSSELPQHAALRLLVRDLPEDERAKAMSSLCLRLIGEYEAGGVEPPDWLVRATEE